MARNYSLGPENDYRQLELCFGRPPQEKNSELEDIIRNHSTVPDFLREAKPFLDYPHPQRVPEILVDYFPGRFGRQQVIDSSDLLKLKKIMNGVYDTYSHYIQFLEGAIPYSLDDAYLGENAAEKQELMARHLGKRVQSKIAEYGEYFGYENQIGRLFRGQVLKYQDLISKGSRRK